MTIEQTRAAATGRTGGADKAEQGMAVGPVQGVASSKRTRRANAPAHRHGLGFSLLECVIAMVVMSLGALGVARLQLALHLTADSARERLEAARLLQQKMEELRSLTHLSANPATMPHALSANDAPSVGGNTSYARRWAILPLSLGRQLSLATVDIDWQGRAGQVQTLGIVSLIAYTDPADEARLALQAAASAQDDAIDASRHAAIPVLAIDWGNGTSVLTVTGEVLVYDNRSGAVIARCKAPAPSANDADAPLPCGAAPAGAASAAAAAGPRP